MSLSRGRAAGRLNSGVRPKMQDINHSYSNDVMTTIWRLQMIEFMLKMYITATHDLIRNKVGRSIPYKFW